MGRRSTLARSDGAGADAGAGARSSLAIAVDAAAGLGVAAGFAISAHAHGAYAVSAWGPLGVVLAIVVAILLVAGRLPGARLWPAAAALVLLGCWSLASTAWGGLPDEAWRMLDRSVLAAAALILGSQLATSGRRAEMALAGILLGATVLAGEVLVRLATGTAPVSWAGVGPLDGQVGYKNAQAAVVAIGIPLAVRLVGTGDRRLRAAAGGASGLLLGALLLAQSRAALIALAVGVLVQVWWTRSRRARGFVAGLGAATLLLDVALTRIRTGTLANGNPDGRVATYLAAWFAAALVLAGVAVWGHRAWRPGRAARVVAAAAALVAVAGLALAASRSDLAQAVKSSPPGSPGGGTSSAAASGTHLASLSLNGRKEAWQVAGGLIADHPLIGDGQSAFARRWAAASHTGPTLNILQPHSLELELFSELGAVGLGIFVLFAALLVRALARSRHRARAAAGLAVLIAVIGQASFDWTWSFPALVAATLVVAGAAAGGGTRRAVPIVIRLVPLAGAAAAVVLIGGPYLSDREVSRASARQASDPAAARTDARAALRLDPWNPDALLAEGRVAESAGELDLAAEKYRDAARYSRRPWIAYFNAARVLRRARSPAASRQACLQALRANPGEPVLMTGPCAYDVAGNDWPAVRAGSAGQGYSAFLKDLGCSACTVRVAGPALEATVQGGRDFTDTAYGVRMLGGPDGIAGRVVVDGSIRLPAGQRLTGYLDVLEVRDLHLQPVFFVYLHADRTLNVYAPAGALQADPAYASTGIVVPEGAEPLRFRVSARAGDSLELDVNGRRQVVTRLSSGATSTNARYLRLGIVWYDSLTTQDPVRVLVGGRATRSAAAAGQ